MGTHGRAHDSDEPRGRHERTPRLPGRLDRPDRPEERSELGALPGVRRRYLLRPERHRLRRRRRVLVHRLRQDLAAHRRSRRALLREGGRLVRQADGLRPPRPERSRPLARGDASTAETYTGPSSRGTSRLRDGSATTGWQSRARRRGDAALDRSQWKRTAPGVAATTRGSGGPSRRRHAFVSIPDPMATNVCPEDQPPHRLRTGSAMGKLFSWSGAPAGKLLSLSRGCTVSRSPSRGERAPSTPRGSPSRRPGRGPARRAGARARAAGRSRRSAPRSRR